MQKCQLCGRWFKGKKADHVCKIDRVYEERGVRYLPHDVYSGRKQPDLLLGKLPKSKEESGWCRAGASVQREGKRGWGDKVLCHM